MGGGVVSAQPPRNPPKQIETARDKLLGSVAQTVRLAAAVSQHAEEFARHKRRLFDAYVEAGFTKEEALQLVKGGIL